VRVDQYVTVIGAVQVSVFACLSSSCNHVTEVGGLALKVVTQNDGDFVDVIPSHLTLNKHIIRFVVALSPSIRVFA
jgi:hypothetical protein